MFLSSGFWYKIGMQVTCMTDLVCEFKDKQLFKYKNYNDFHILLNRLLWMIVAALMIIIINITITIIIIISSHMSM